MTSAFDGITASLDTAEESISNLENLSTELWKLKNQQNED